MSWQLPLWLGGPVLRWELVRAASRPWPRLLHYGYIVCLCLFVIGSLPGVGPDVNAAAYPDKRFDPRTVIEVGHDRWMAALKMANGCLGFLLRQQLVLIALLTPIMTTGALGHEKERDTLPALLGTELESWQIVLGKLLGRLALLLRLPLAPLPILLFMAVWADFPCQRVFLAFLQAAVLTFALASVCMWSAVFSRRTSDAILGCYTILVLAYFFGTYITGAFGVLELLDPLAMLDQLIKPAGLRSWEFPVHLVIWGCVGLIAFGLAVEKLRPHRLDQQEQRANRWLWAFRPRVGDEPIRWREQHVIGLAPLPLLRRVPGWMAMIGVFCFSGITALTALRPVACDMCAQALLRGRFATGWEIFCSNILPAFRNPGPVAIGTEVSVMGLLLILAIVLVVGARCGGSIAEEERRKTWENLLMTGLSREEIVQEKRAGVLGAAGPYLVVYALPMLALGFLDHWGVALALFWLTLASVAMLAAARLGLQIAAGGSSAHMVEEQEIGRPRTEPVRGWGP